MRRNDQKDIQKKADRLRGILRGYGSAAIAFSGGVDSALLLDVARETLGEQAVAVTAVSGLMPAREQASAGAFCKERNIRQSCFDPQETEIPGFCKNTKDRCYVCKRALFARICEISKENGLAVVAEGSNTDDEGDYRPGMRALAELGIKSPLREAGLSKSDVRTLAKERGLSVWDKPSAACLASRIAYGERITKEKLRMIDRAEEVLQDTGFRNVRVRLHGELARVEVAPEEISRLLSETLRPTIVEKMKEIGLSYVTVDLQGYRTGSMNEVL